MVSALFLMCMVLVLVHFSSSVDMMDQKLWTLFSSPPSARVLPAGCECAWNPGGVGTWRWRAQCLHPCEADEWLRELLFLHQVIHISLCVTVSRFITAPPRHLVWFEFNQMIAPHFPACRSPWGFQWTGIVWKCAGHSFLCLAGELHVMTGRGRGGGLNSALLLLCPTVSLPFLSRTLIVFVFLLIRSIPFPSESHLGEELMTMQLNANWGS